MVSGLTSNHAFATHLSATRMLIDFTTLISCSGCGIKINNYNCGCGQVSVILYSLVAACCPEQRSGRFSEVGFILDAC